MIQLPRLLDSQMHEVRRLNPSSLAVTLTDEPLSNAQMILPMGDGDPVAFFSWVEIYGLYGSMGIYCVKTADETFGSNVSLYLEHGLCTLQRDTTAEAKYRPSTGSGSTSGGISPRSSEMVGGGSSGSSSEDETKHKGSIAKLLAEAMDFQRGGYWQLGTVEADNTSYTVDFQNTNVLTCIVRIVRQDPALHIVTDQTTWPWTLHVLRAETIPSCECRLTRNADDVHVNHNTSSFYTRVVSDRLKTPLVADTAEQYGEHTYYYAIPDNVSDADARHVCEVFLETHKQPAISISVSGMQLAKRTGEPLDRLQIGRMCRVALPDYNAVYNERIVSAMYSNLIKQPERVQLVLAASQQDAVEILAQAAYNAGRSKGGGGAAYSAVKQQNEEEQKSMIIQFYDEQLEDTRQRIRYAGISLDGTAASVNLLASQKDLNDNVTTLNQAIITLNGSEGKLTAKVTRDEVSAAVELSGDGVTISGGIITLDGAVIANKISASLFTGATITGVQDFTTINAHGSLCDFITGQFQNLNLLATTDIKFGNTAYKPCTMTVGGDIVGYFLGHDNIAFNWSDIQAVKALVSAAEIRGANSVTINEDDIVLKGLTGLDVDNYTLRINVEATASNGASESTIFEQDLTATIQAIIDAHSGGGRELYKASTLMFNGSSYSSRNADLTVHLADTNNPRTFSKTSTQTGPNMTLTLTNASSMGRYLYYFWSERSDLATRLYPSRDTYLVYNHSTYDGVY